MSAIRTLRKTALAACCLLAFAGAWGGGAPLTVEVFANSAMAITPESAQGLPYALTVYRIDGMQSMEETLNQQLPQSEAEAMEWVRQNRARIEREYRPAIIAAANGITLMMAYKLNRIPAIVINRKAVVYGITDVNQAIALAQERGAL